MPVIPRQMAIVLVFDPLTIKKVDAMSRVEAMCADKRFVNLLNEYAEVFVDVFVDDGYDDWYDHGEDSIRELRTQCEFPKDCERCIHILVCLGTPLRSNEEEDEEMA